LKVVSLLSGGIDSSTLLYWLKKYAGHDVYTMTIAYGQKHFREIKAAKTIAEQLRVPWIFVDLRSIGDLLKSALTTNSIDVPEVPADVEHYDTLRITVVPNRNMILLAIAAAYAKSINANTIAYAAHFSDRGIYPDCRWEFVQALQLALRLSLDDPKFELLTPFVAYSKADIVKLGSSLGVPYELTWSCYKGLELHCGVCSSCRERKRAFAEASVPDPTTYVE